MTSTERAQALVDLQSTVAAEGMQSIADAWNGLQQKWQDEVRADPEMGGAKLEENLGMISNLLQTIVAPGGTTVPAEVKALEDLRTAMNETGAGNNPHIVRFLFKLAKANREGTVALGNPAPTERSQAERLFPTTK